MSKQSTLISLASRAKGVTVDEAMAATGWTKRHSVRGFFSNAGGMARLGLRAGRSQNASGDVVYRIVKLTARKETKAAA